MNLHGEDLRFWEKTFSDLIALSKNTPEDAARLADEAVRLRRERLSHFKPFLETAESSVEDIKAVTHPIMPGGEMSYVHNFVLVVGLPSCDNIIERIDIDHKHAFIRVDHHSVGPKGMESLVYVAAVNYVSVKRVVKVLRSFFQDKTEYYREEIQLIYNQQEGEIFTMISIFAEQCSGWIDCILGEGHSGKCNDRY